MVIVNITILGNQGEARLGLQWEFFGGYVASESQINS